MMRRIFMVSTVLFWLGIAGFWAGSVLLPGDTGTQAVAAEEPSYTLAQVARHATRDNCWMAIRGQVYDFTAYIPQHPADPAVFLAWCGKDATQAFETKTKGRPHSPYAEQLLPKYRIGTLKGD